MTDAPFSHTIWAFEEAQYKFFDDLEQVGLTKGEQFERIGWDDYDNSIEFYDVGTDVRLTEPQQKIVAAAGFGTAFVNHKDGWETHYHWSGEFKLSRGWRRRWVNDPNVKTTRSIGEGLTPENAGYYEISYWPESWGPKTEEWKDTGYMRVVPDPLETDNAAQRGGK